MFHEEAVILGVLCWRGTPDGEWIEFTAHQLTRKLLEERSARETEVKS